MSGLAGACAASAPQRGVRPGDYQVAKQDGRVAAVREYHAVLRERCSRDRLQDDPSSPLVY